VIEKEIEIKAEFYEADPMGVVWHGRYVQYFERARTALFEDLGFGWPEMNAAGYLWPVVDLQVRYTRSVRPGQRVRVRVGIKEWENRVVLDYAIFDAVSGERLTKGSTTQVAVRESDGELLFEVPEVLKKLIRAAL
jgi:acyl-CoA thioester hydrolase